MEVLILQVFVSLMLVGGSLLLFWFTCRQRDFDHADRLALLPVEGDEALIVSNLDSIKTKGTSHE
jgi:cbb3-type cytochrome oxidase maturation protein